MTKRDLKTFSKYKVVQSLAEKIQLLQGLGSQLDTTQDKRTQFQSLYNLKEKFVQLPLL